MEHDLNDFTLDMNVIYIGGRGFGKEAQARSAEDRRVIDLERYRILKTMRTLISVQ
jgi:hypothetical protein